MNTIKYIAFIVLLFFPVLGCYSSRDDDEQDGGEQDGDEGDANSSEKTDSGTREDVNEIEVIRCEDNCPQLEWVELPAGRFLMGSPDGFGKDFEHPQHEVSVEGFKILKTEVTVSQYAKCLEAGVCSEPSTLSNSYNWTMPNRDDFPINGVDWYQASTFSKWVGGRLPSEAEWEYAARSGGRDILYPWGNEQATCDYAVIDDGVDGCGTELSAEVCSRPMGNSAQGLCDMAGNLWEWVEDDFHKSYDGAPSNGEAWIDNPRWYQRILRGGAYRYDADRCRNAYRMSFVDSIGDNIIGFRVVMSQP